MVRRSGVLAAAALASACGGRPLDGAAAEPLTACDPPVEPRPFRNWSGGTTPVHAANDVVVPVGQPYEIAAKLAYGPTGIDLDDEDVVLATGDGTCDGWRFEAEARTDEDGWVRFARPAVDRPGVRDVQIVVPGDGTRAGARVWAIAPGTRAVLFDIDGTLTTGDAELLDSLLADDPPDAREGAVSVAHWWHDRGYLVVYVTGRVYGLRDATRRWLDAHDFPPGPLFTTEDPLDALPSRDRVGAFKRRRLEQLVAAGLVFEAAYGNAQTDVCAYAEAGIAPARTWLTQDRAPCDDFPAPNRLGGYVEHLRTLRAAEQ